MLPGLNISENYFWSSFENILNKFSKINEELLDKRKYLQNKLIIGILIEEIKNSTLLNIKTS